MDNDNDQKVIEGEVTNTDLVTVTNLIQNYLGQINENKHVLTEHKQMVEDALNNDETYRNQVEEVKKANIKLDRKILSELAMNHPKVFEELVKKVA